ncbi:hypothetical protein HN682_08830 [Candidatus Peregrinibacteria bacterium]|jgi:hypothetical protein|nr:hypothetical protein [candidate division WWE3 bacterium]MBT7930000.1 hypothetical protein [Candidatus Peregrinibacteria bacterium]
MIQLPDKCLRDRDDCEAYAQIIDDNEKSFFCCGVNDGSTRKIKEDKFTLCFKNKELNELSHNDRRDLTSMLSVISQTLCIDDNIKNNGE